MVRHVGGSRRRSRSKFRKAAGQRGKVSLSRYFSKYEINDKVQLNADPSIHSALYHPRFHGKVGIINAKRGRCYEVWIKDRNKSKLIVIHPVHLRRI